MRIILKRLIKHRINMASSVVVNKIYESNVVPTKGYFIEDTAFSGGEEVSVIEVSINYAENSCTVSLEPFEVNDSEPNAIKQAVEFYKEEGWCD